MQSNESHAPISGDHAQESSRSLVPARNPNILVTWVLVLVGMLLAVLVGVWMQGKIAAIPDYDQKRAIERAKFLQEVRAEEEKLLSSYAWTDEKAQVARIPISRAMEIVAAELKRKPVRPAYPVGGAPEPASGVVKP